ncbi:hypothetical protein LguiA_011184 [Lonicera macranthoides]
MLVTRLLSPVNLVLNCQYRLILKLTQYDIVVRACYEDCCLELKAKVLAWLLVIDTFFLLDHLSSYAKNTADNEKKREWAREIIMVEIQIPLVLLWIVHPTIL